MNGEEVLLSIGRTLGLGILTIIMSIVIYASVKNIIQSSWKEWKEGSK